MIVGVVGHIGSDNSTVSGLDSYVTNDFSIWMSSVRFLFFEFNFESDVADIISSGNNSVSSVVGLALGVYNWNITEGFLEVNHNEIFHDITNSADLELVSTSESVNTFFSN
jgi:hypothetical protein